MSITLYILNYYLLIYCTHLLYTHLLIQKTLKPSPLFKKKNHLKILAKSLLTLKPVKKIILSHIFHYPLVNTALPNTSAHFDTSTVVYTLMNLIGSKIVNLNKFLIISL